MVWISHKCDVVQGWSYAFGVVGVNYGAFVFGHYLLKKVLVACKEQSRCIKVAQAKGHLFEENMNGVIWINQEPELKSGVKILVNFLLYGRHGPKSSM